MASVVQNIRRGPRVEWRIFFLAILMLCGLGVLVGKLWWEQVARGPFWTKKIAGRSQVTVRIPSVRGEIRDRNGITLVANRASYEVDFYLPSMVKGFKDQNKGWVPVTKYKAPVRQMLTEKQLSDAIRRKAKAKFDDITEQQVRACAEFAVKFAYEVGGLDDKSYAEVATRSSVRSGRSKRAIAQRRLHSPACARMSCAHRHHTRHRCDTSVAHTVQS